MNDLKYVLNCQICSNLMLDPVTIQCGHSFCRDCTIRWFFKYNKSNCPLCRQKAKQEIPQVNINLKQLIHYVTNRKRSDLRVQRPRKVLGLVIWIKSWWSWDLFIFSPFKYFSRLVMKLFG